MDTTPRSTPAAPTRGRRSRRLAATVGALALAVALPLAAGAATSATPADPPPPAPPQHQPGGHDLTRADVDTWLDGVVGSALQTTGIPGAAVSVVADGQVLTSRGYGLADTGTEGSPARPVDPDDTLFRVGSVSKVVSATAVMQLVEEGRLDLDADVQQYLDFDLDTPKGAVTLRHLLTHTAGFEEVITGLIGLPGSERDLGDVMRTDPPAQVFVPGTTPAYSNYGASLAGYVAERVAGKPFVDLVQQEVLDRAGMASSSFAQPLPDDLAARLAKGYPDDTQPAYPVEVVNAAPAGALSATASDMARFMLGHLGDLPADQALLDPATLDEMHRPALGADQLGSLAAGQRMDLAFFDDSTPGVPAFGHDGDTNVFHTAMRMFPDSDAGIFVTFNGNGRDAVDTLELRTTVLQGFADRYLRAHDAAADGSAASAAPAGDPEAAAALAGTWLSSRSPFSNPGALLNLSGQTEIVPRADGTIAVTPKPLGVTTGVYEKAGDDLWREVGGDAVLATRASADGGPVDAISWGASFTLLRAEPWQVASVAMPLLLVAVAVLLVSVVAWPATAIAGIGRRRAARADTAVTAAPRPRRSRAHLLSRIGQAVTLLALVDVSAATLRTLQVLQVLGALAVIPAALAARQAVRTRRGAWVVAGRILVVLALVAVAAFAVGFRLLAPSVSY
ncbi:serine hydrolase domain-containing protein [Clavibacter sepedonicus]|uniref:Beta-lactamase n=1 Tax=Clavibacter sepedonicus TaxID=31964 RepID=B0RG80_CLASE|nr:serine hydrolase domain-containing protein [Clavibacter sepedonicus]OQJ47967.1 serine hydrolase [Clavibacter sepedonicus]OQJ53522.1 serine hydrolase [Clavibacter sepedonicus]UUK66368.1 beta-lactamase family protein [Clavibacter sepedonicus]CAQ02372.1 putative beta-lactamase [Clavibacter sepedonicus]